MIDKSIWFNFLKKSLSQNQQKKISITVFGESMMPTLKNGDIVMIEHVKISDISVGDIIVHYHWKGNMTIHRVYNIIKKNNSIKIQTKGDNNKCADNYLLTEEEIIGRVIKKADE